MIKVNDLLTLYDDWNGHTTINDSKLNPIVRDLTDNVYHMEDVKNLEVESFGFYDGDFIIRVSA